MNNTPISRTFHWSFYLALCLGLGMSHLLVNNAMAQNTMTANMASSTPKAPTSQPATSQPASPVKSVGDFPLKKIQLISKHIDQLVAQNLRKNNLRPNAPANDETLLRRYFLAIIGRIPTYDEAIIFRKRKDQQRRSDLIDHLLDSPGYVSDMFNFYADLLRVKSKHNRIIGEPYINWVKQSVKESKPYDQMVYEMLTAQGHVWNNGAVGYYQRDMGMPLDNMSNTTRIFLGTQVGCAQCHDHPFDIWTQMEFNEMSAYTYGIVTTNARWKYPNLKQLYNKIRRTQKNKDDPRTQIVIQAARNMLEPLQFPVFTINKDLRLPDDYKYDDAKPKSIVAPRTIFGDIAAAPKGSNRPEIFAKWLTAPTNPRFTKVIANRLWKDAFGVGLIEPLDDIKEDTVASNPELMAYLIQVMIDLKYDVKQFQRVIYNTRTYQRKTSIAAWDSDKPYHFPGPILKRMTAPQIWDSVLTLAIQDLDERPGNVTGGRGYDYDKFNEYIKMDADTLFDLVNVQADQLQRSREFDKIRKPLSRQIQQAKNKKDTVTLRKLQAKIAALRTQYSDIIKMKQKSMEPQAEERSAMERDPRRHGACFRNATTCKTGTFPARLWAIRSRHHQQWL
ncbi:MAG: DUF1549 domain-containing protein [Phycisphaeraceae bacterium]|nr:DUF1549 domain-containing protein [Phycisphaeraceae bacterium]